MSFSYAQQNSNKSLIEEQSKTISNEEEDKEKRKINLNPLLHLVMILKHLLLKMATLIIVIVPKYNNQNTERFLQLRKTQKLNVFLAEFGIQ